MGFEPSTLSFKSHDSLSSLGRHRVLRKLEVWQQPSGRLHQGREVHQLDPGELESLAECGSKI